MGVNRWVRGLLLMLKLVGVTTIFSRISHAREWVGARVAVVA